MPRSITILLLIVAATIPLSLFAETITERQALLNALEQRYEVRILRLKGTSDSLNPESAKSAWLPQISLKTELSAIPFDSTSATNSGNKVPYLSGSSSSLDNANSISVSQHLPGGGTVGGSVNFDNSVNLEHTDSTSQATSVQVHFTQPLLRDAWQADPVVYRITLARLDNERFSLEQQQRMLTYCSDIRTRFWNLFESQAIVSLYEQEATYAKTQLGIERSRVAIGISPPLDTLSAKLSYINATARLHDAQSDRIQLQDELAFYGGINDRFIIIDSLIDISTLELPPVDTMIVRAKRFDPRLRIFSIAAKRLERIRNQTRNDFLPRLDITGSLKRSTDENSSTRTNYFVSNSIIGLIASYDLPIRSRKISLRQNAIDAEINTLEKENYLKQLHLRLSELNRSWKRELRAIEIAVSAEDIARQTLTATREGYAVGTIDRISLDKAENDYRRARIELLRKQLLMKKLEIVFDEITGATLSNLGVQLQ